LCAFAPARPTRTRCKKNFAHANNGELSTPDGGWLIDGNAHQMVIQFYDVGAVFAYCAVGTFITLKVIDFVLDLRVSRDVEVEGLDINLHGETVHD
jgi:ammonia channel protein AmtB